MGKGNLSVGIAVRFLTGSLGASKRDELSTCVEETFGVGDGGVIAFKHPNPKLKEWWYAEVTSKVSGEKLYVGVTAKICAYKNALPQGAYRVLRRCKDSEALSGGDVGVARVLAKRGFCNSVQNDVFALTTEGAMMLDTQEGA